MQCFSNGILATLKLVFQQHSVLTPRIYFLITVFQQNTKKKLVLINNKPTVTKMSSSHRGIFTTAITKHLPLNTGIHQSMLKSIFLLTEGFTNDYAEKHLPFDRGIHQGTLLFHRNSILLLTE